jgi:hypothetical protein
MLGKAFTMASETNENIIHDNLYELSSIELFTGLLDLNEALPEPYKLKQSLYSKFRGFVS